jgi:uncharacterized protein (TIGR02147 family)
MPSIFEYLDYRKFLQDAYKEKKKKNYNFSHRYLGQKGGFDPGHFSKVITGQRNLTNSMVRKFAKAFSLSEAEEEYFENLVFFNQATTHADKQYYLKKTLNSKGIEIKPFSKDQFEYYNKWYYGAVRELIHIHRFNGNYEELAKKLSPPIKVKEAQEAIALLERLRFIKRNEKGDYIVTDPLMKSDFDLPSVLVDNYVLTCIDLAKKQFDKVPRSQKNYSNITFSFSSEHIPRLINCIREFRKDIMRKIAVEEKPDKVFQLNFQLLPLSKECTDYRKMHEEREDKEEGEQT